MATPAWSGTFRSIKKFFTLMRRAIPAVLIANVVFAQPPQSPSEENRVAELKRLVIETLQLRAGDIVADVGCGDGFYTVPLARFLGPAGKVFAVDINDSELFKLKQHLGDEGLKNVEIIKGAEDDPELPEDRLDAALIVNAYHEMTAHGAVLGHIRTALKQHGVLVVMEGISDVRKLKSRDEQVKHHQLSPHLAKQEVERAGFDIVEIHDPFLERPQDEDGKSRWWVLIARKPAR